MRLARETAAMTFPTDASSAPTPPPAGFGAPEDIFLRSSAAVGPGGSGAVVVATLRRRAGAAALDGVIVGLVTFVVVLIGLIVAAVANGGDASFSARAEAGASSGQLLGLAAVWGFGSLIPLLYWLILPAREGLWRGRTIGKKQLDLQIIAADGTALTARAARIRALAFGGPQLVLLVAGPVLDAIANTPPLFTFLALGLGTVYSLVDLVICPASGFSRRTLHDHLAGTVVVDCRTAPPFDPAAAAAPAVPPAGRPKTAATKVWLGLAGLGYAIAALVLIGTAFATDRSANATPADRDAAAPAGPGISGPPYSASELTVDDTTSQDAAQRVGLELGVAFVRCTLRTHDYKDCVEAGELGLPDGIDVSEIDPRPGRPSDVGRIVVTDIEVLGSAHATIGVYDRTGILWGVGIDDALSVTPLCISAKGEHCSDPAANPGGDRYVSDRAAAARVVALAQR